METFELHGGQHLANLRSGLSQPAAMHGGLGAAPLAFGTRAAAPVQGGGRDQVLQPVGELTIRIVSGPGAVERHFVHCSQHGALSAHFRAVDARRKKRCVWCEGSR